MGRSGTPLTPEERQFVETIYHTYAGLMLYTAGQCTPDPETARDLVQECLVRLMGHVPTLRQMDRRKTAAYIAVTIRRLYLDRTKREQGLLSLEEEEVRREAQEKTVRESVPMDADARLDVMGVLGALSQRDQLLLTGYYVEGLTEAELARQLDCKPDSVRMLLSRARKRARKLLKQEKGGAEDAG